VVTGKVYNESSDPRYIGVYISSNGGDTWTALKIANETAYAVQAAAVAPSNGSIIYAGGYTDDYSKGVLYSTANGGATWTRQNWTYRNIAVLAVDPQDPKIVYAATSWDGVYRSADGGQSWTKYGDLYGAYSIIVNKANPNEVFLGGGNGVYRSTNRGLTWTDISEELLERNITHLDFHVATRTLYAGTYNAGIWKKKV
jgi:photosystem II stability/assembly factor-like uncharacterized protein